MIANLEAFCRTYEAGSFTRSARILGVSPQATSRAVARLEASLGVTLFKRTTRKLAPTDAGQRYYEHGLRALAALSDGQRALAQGGAAPEGRVRISVPTTYGHSRFLPSLAAFAERYPRVAVDVAVENRNVDLFGSGFDLAIRRTPIRDRGLVARRLGELPIGVYASPEYLARAGTPRSPAELERHRCIAFLVPSTGRALAWDFAGGVTFAPVGGYRVADDALGTVSLARAGLGLVQAFDFLVADDVARGTLVEVLGSYRGAPRGFALVYPKQAKPAAAVRALIDYVVAASSRGIARDRKS